MDDIRGATLRRSDLNKFESVSCYPRHLTDYSITEAVLFNGVDYNGVDHVQRPCSRPYDVHIGRNLRHREELSNPMLE